MIAEDALRGEPAGQPADAATEVCSRAKFVNGMPTGAEG